MRASTVYQGRQPPLRWRSPNQRRIVAAAAGPSYDTDAQAYFTAVEGAGGTINTAGKDAYDDFVVALKGYSLWTIIDRLPCWNGQDAFAALRDLKAPSVTYTAVNSPTFTAKTGYDFNGTTQYIQSGFIPSSAGGAYAQDSAHVAVWCLDNVQSSAQIDAEASDGTRLTRLCARSAADAVTTGVNAASAAAVGSTATSIGLTMLSRTASNLTTVYRSGASLGTSATASNGLPTVEFYFGARNNSGVAASFSARAQALASIGGAMDATQAANFHTAAAAFVAAMSAS